MLTTSTEMISWNVLNSLIRAANDVGIDANDLLVEAFPGFHRLWTIEITLYFKPLDFRRSFSIDYLNGENTDKNVRTIQDNITLFLSEIKKGADPLLTIPGDKILDKQRNCALWKERK